MTLYFKTTKDDIVTDGDILKTAKINGDYDSFFSMEDIRNYALKMKGIKEELHPSVEDLIKSGYSFLATRMLYENSDMRLVEARNKVKEIERTLMNHAWY